MWNSEVGKRSVGIQSCWFQAVCANHIVWDAVEVVDFIRKHTASVGDDLAESVQTSALTVEETRKAVKAKLGRATEKPRGTREKYAAPGGLLVTVTSGRSVTDGEIESALVHALDVVRKRIEAGVH